ncbi:hypothetical protein KAR34_08015 [bacterium]|nr:hypothetical protein [bacterium]
MNKNILWILMVLFFQGLSGVVPTPGLAREWPNNYNLRVMTLGGAFLALEDQTTDLSLFNMENPAGLAFTPKENWINFGIYYDNSVSSITTRDYYTEYYSWPPGSYSYISTILEQKDDFKTLALYPAEGEFSGFNYWVSDNWAININLMPVQVQSKYREKYFEYIYNYSPEKPYNSSNSYDFSFNGSSFGVYSDLKTAIRLGDVFSLGGELAYIFTNSTDMDTYTECEANMSLLHWQIGSGLKIGKDIALQLGVTAGNDDEVDDFRTEYTFPDDIIFIAGNDDEVDDFTSEHTFSEFKTTYTYTPATILLAAQSVFNIKDFFQIGTQAYWKSREITKQVKEYEGKYSQMDGWGVMPMIKGMIPLGYDCNLLLGAHYIFSKAETDYEMSNSKNETQNREFGSGLGFQFFKKKIQLAFQYNRKSIMTNIVTNIFLEDVNDVFGVGIEGWVTPYVALRSAYTHDKSYFDNSTRWINSSTISAGMAIKIAEHYNLDIMGRYTPKTTGQNMEMGPNWGIYTNIHIPLTIKSEIKPETKLTPKYKSPNSNKVTKLALPQPEEYRVGIFDFIKNTPKLSLFNTLKEIADLHNKYADLQIIITALYQPNWKKYQQERLDNILTYFAEQGLKNIEIKWVETNDLQDTTRFFIKVE